METQTAMQFVWPELGQTSAIVALVLALAVFVFGALSGAWANKVRIVAAVLLGTAIGWFAMPMLVKAARLVHALDGEIGVVVLVTCAMLFVSAITACIYEIITVTLPDVGLSSKK